MDPAKIEQFLRSKIRQGDADNALILNTHELASSPELTQRILNSLIEDYSVRIRACRHEISSTTNAAKLNDLGNANQRLDKRLQRQLQMLRRSEGSLAGTSDVLECDAAKSRSDKLIEVLNAKNTWSSSLRVADMLGESEQNELFNCLVTLQQANVVLKKYVPSDEREQILESRKDLFLGWFQSAILFAIDNGDVAQLTALKEKFVALDRFGDYRKAFGDFVINKISTFMEETAAELTIWNLLDEAFSLWKRTVKMAELLGDDGSSFVARSFYEGIRSRDTVVEELVKRLILNSADTFAAANELSSIRKEFLEYVRNEGDKAVLEAFIHITDDLYEMIRDDYEKHVKSVLFMKINQISQLASQKSGRKHDWIMPVLEEVHSTMREIVSESVVTFGSHFSKHIVSSFEKGVDQLNSLFRKSDLLSIKSSATSEDSNTRPQPLSPLDEMNDKLTSICTSGYLINMINDINAFIHETHLSAREPTDPKEPSIIRNTAQLERFAKKVVNEKVNDLSRVLILPMIEEMNALKLSANALDSMDVLKLSLPSFSITPHNYITTVGHGLLNQMNNIGAYNTDRHFRTAVSSAAGSEFNEEECDLWVLKVIANMVMESFCTSVGDLSKLSQKVLRQYNADIIFLMEALEDLRLQPTPSFNSLSEKLNALTVRKE